MGAGTVVNTKWGQNQSDSFLNLNIVGLNLCLELDGETDFILFERRGNGQSHLIVTNRIFLRKSMRSQHKAQGGLATS